MWKYGTLYNTILGIARSLLETRENIKIESPFFYHIICDRFSWGFLLLKNKIQNGLFSKWPFFKITNSQNLFVKISWISPGVALRLLRKGLYILIEGLWFRVSKEALLKTSLLKHSIIDRPIGT